MKIIQYFGEVQQPIFLYVQKQQSAHTLTIDSLKEQSYIIKELIKMPEIKNATDITYFIDQICQLEFGQKFEDCTDEQINIAINDLLEEKNPQKIKILDTDDFNEKIEYNRYPRISKGKSVDELDIKNIDIEYNKKTINFSIEVYDLSSFQSKIKSPINLVNVIEWYLDFENLIKPDERLNISYKIAAHIEPKHSLWQVGEGILDNIRRNLLNLKNRELFNVYEKSVILWIKPASQDMYFPVKLETGEINFNIEENQIKISVSRNELGNYGIAPRFEVYEIPAKLSNFKAGTRFYQTPFIKLPWFRIDFNTSYLINKLEKIIKRPLLGGIADRLLNNIAGLSWEDFDEFFGTIDENMPLPDMIALKDIESSWFNIDDAPDTDFVSKVLFIKSPLYNDLQISAKGFISKDYIKPAASLIILNLNLTGNYEETLESTRDILKNLEKIDSAYSFISVEATGDIVISVQIDEVTTEANVIIMPMIFIVIITILFIFFRRLSYIAMPLLALVVSTIWLFGTMVLLDMPFTTIAVALVPIIMGLGVDYSVHLLHNYRTELSKGSTPAEAIKKSILEIGTAMFLAMLTTVIAFLSFLSASLPPIRDFGLLLAPGILYTFITAITLQAAVRYVTDRGKKKYKKGKKKSIKLDLLMGKVAKTILCHQKKILALILLITVISAIGATQIKTGFNFESFVPENNPAVELFGEIEENFPFASQSQEYILIEGDVATVESLKGIIRTHGNLEDDSYIEKNFDGSAKTISIYTIINQAVKNNDTILDKFNLDKNTMIPQKDQDVENLFNYLYESEEYGILVRNNIHKTNGEYDACIIRVFIDMAAENIETEDLGEYLELLTEELNEDIENYGNAEAIATGQLIITNKITSSLTESQVMSTAISLVLATIVLIIAYRKPTLGLIAIIPVMISMVWILGTMYFIGYSLNIMTITVTSLTIGIGIDYAIHATERFKLVADKTGDINLAVCETISRTGGALLIAALTTTLGFATLILAPIPPEQQFGVILAMTITYSFITSVLLLPLILARWAKWRKKRKGFIISQTPAKKEKSEDFDNFEYKTKK
jgi:predicted RND superfamily exporter protein